MTILLYCTSREFISFAEKKAKGTHLTMLDKKRLMMCKQELVRGNKQHSRQTELHFSL